MRENEGEQGKGWGEESFARRVVQVTSPGGCLVLSKTGQTPEKMTGQTPEKMDPIGIEPTTSTMPLWRSPS